MCLQGGRPVLGVKKSLIYTCITIRIVAVNIFKDNDNHFSMKVAIYLLINNTKTQENWQAFI